MNRYMNHQIEAITRENIHKAVEIRHKCFLKDYLGVLPQEILDCYSFEKDLNEISEWLFENTEDFRAGFLYSIDHEAVGMAIGSMSELESCLNAVELNYLFVSEAARHCHVGKKLMMAIAAKYSENGVEGMLLYNWRLLQSNQFYRHLGGEILATEYQTPGGKALETDIFYWPLTKLLNQGPVSKLIWFSGTGSVREAAEQLSKKLLYRGHVNLSVTMSDCLSGYYQHVISCDVVPTECLYVIYPVHAFGAPEIVYHWIQTLSKLNGIKTAVISVSGGGEIWPNTACRQEVIKLLEEKGCNVTYERMLVMPSNMLVETEEDLVAHLFRALPEKLEDLIDDLENDVIRRVRGPLSAFIIKPLSKMERKYAHNASDYFVITDKCTACGHCAEFCPVENIELDSNGKPYFNDGCLLCLKCYYGCPARAIESPKLKRWLLKGYDIEALKKMGERIPEKSPEECCKSPIWWGVKRYLSNVKY